MERLALAFSGKKREEKRQAMVLQTVQTVAQWAQSNPMRSFRVYRTPQGLRLLFVDKLYDPTSEETLAILRGLKTDPMYIKLTQKQECFRARLTAKPWRCGCPRPPHLYPWDSPEAEQEFRQWESRYTSVAAKYRACEYVKAFGAMAQITAVQAVIKAHDDGTMMDAPLPLG